jgi:hypothetical protein
VNGDDLTHDSPLGIQTIRSVIDNLNIGNKL